MILEASSGTSQGRRERVGGRTGELQLKVPIRRGQHLPLPVVHRSRRHSGPSRPGRAPGRRQSPIEPVDHGDLGVLHHGLLPTRRSSGGRATADRRAAGGFARLSAVSDEPEQGRSSLMRSPIVSSWSTRTVELGGVGDGDPEDVAVPPGDPVTFQYLGELVDQCPGAFQPAVPADSDAEEGQRRTSRASLGRSMEAGDDSVPLDASDLFGDRCRSLASTQLGPRDLPIALQLFQQVYPT